MEKNRSRDKEINLTISTNNVKAKESDKWFQCEVCDFECPKEETLQKHTKHNGLHNEKADERKFYCHKCSVSFKTKKSFKKHEQSHNYKVLISCSKCDFQCTSEKDLTNHMNVNHMKGSIDLTSKSNEAPEVDEAELDEWIAKAAEFNNVK